jgi:hypothetical protein
MHLYAILICQISYQIINLMIYIGMMTGMKFDMYKSFQFLYVRKGTLIGGLYKKYREL